MSTIVPPLPGPVTTPAAAGPPVLTVAAGSLPDALASGGAFDATVLPPQPGQPRGLLELATAAGTLTLRTRGDLSLPAGATVTLLPTGGDGAAGLRLVAVNGRPLAPGLLPLPPSGGGATPAALLPTAGQVPPAMGQAGRAAAPGVPSPAVLTPGAAPIPAAGITATLLRPATSAVPPGTATAQLPVLPPGTRLVVRIADLTLPTQGATATAPDAPVPATPGGPPVPPAATSPTVAATPAPGPAAPPPGPPAAAGSLPAPPGLPPALDGTVTAHAPGNQALVTTPLGTLSLPVADQLPVGAGLTLDLVSLPLPPETGTTAAAKAQPQGLGPNGWPALADAAAALTAADDLPAMQELVRLLPQVGPQLAANLSLFANALRSGEVRAVFGAGAVRGLEKAGRRDLAQQLEDDVDALADDADRPVGNGEWRCFTLPLVYGGTIDPIHLYVRRPPGDDEESAAGVRRGDDRRFLLEVSMSRLGRVQMDGLVQRESKRFDLIIRTGQPLPEDMRRDILGLFTASSDAVGTQGSVTFQPGGRFVDLPPAAPPGTSFSV